MLVLGIELFDCKFFDISPAEARGMDPTQRQVLEVSYISLQGAGWTKKMLQAKPANIGVFVGLDKNEWNALPKDISGGFAASSGANAITSNRFNYCMNLKAEEIGMKALEAIYVDILRRIKAIIEAIYVSSKRPGRQHDAGHRLQLLFGRHAHREALPAPQALRPLRGSKQRL